MQVEPKYGQNLHADVTALFLTENILWEAEEGAR